MTVHLVDQHQVAPADVAAFIALVRDEGVPLMEAAGATFVLCEAAPERLRRAMRDCDRFVPGITRCAVGTNTAGGPIELVWETTYESVGAYRTTYMTHPYHAALLDRFLLPDCPERITTTNTLGAGLIGYAVDRDRPLGPVAVRRLL